MQAPQRCISLQDWKVCSPLEASGLTFHKLQSCFPFLLIFSFQRSFTTHTHALTKQGKVMEAAWYPDSGNHSRSISDANLQPYYKDTSIYSQRTHLEKAPLFRSACLWRPRLWDQVSHRWRLFFPVVQKRPGSTAAKEGPQRWPGYRVWPIAPVWTGVSDKGCSSPANQPLPEQHLGAENIVYTHTSGSLPWTVNSLSETSEEQYNFSYHISLRRFACPVLEGVRSLILIKIADLRLFLIITAVIWIIGWWYSTFARLLLLIDYLHLLVYNVRVLLRTEASFLILTALHSLVRWWIGLSSIP